MVNLADEQGLELYLTEISDHPSRHFVAFLRHARLMKSPSSNHPVSLHDTGLLGIFGFYSSSGIAEFHDPQQLAARNLPSMFITADHLLRIFARSC